MTEKLLLNCTEKLPNIDWKVTAEFYWKLLSEKLLNVDFKKVTDWKVNECWLESKKSWLKSNWLKRYWMLIEKLLNGYLKLTKW